MRIAMPVIGGVLLFATVAVAVRAAPAETEPNIIEMRQTGYDLVQGTVTGIKEAVAAKADPKPYADGAAAIARWGKLIPLLFPKGSDTGNNTKAKPEIWSDRAGFEKAASNMNEAASKVSEIAKSGNVEGFAAQFKVLGDACGACHKQYRYRTS